MTTHHFASLGAAAAAIPNVLAGLLIAFGALISPSDASAYTNDQLLVLGMLMFMLGLGLMALFFPLRNGRTWALRCGASLAALSSLFWATILVVTLLNHASTPGQPTEYYVGCVVFFVLFAIPAVAGGECSARP